MIREFKINNPKDVENFLRYLIAQDGLSLGMSFHPDDSFDNYMNHKGESMFTENEVDMLTQTMVECFNVCERNNADIYEIAYKYAIAA